MYLFFNTYAQQRNVKKEKNEYTLRELHKNLIRYDICMAHILRD